MNPITIPVIELKPALAGLAKIVGKRTTLPVLSHVRLERTSTGSIELAATDLDSAAIVRLGTLDQGAPTTFLVPFEDLNNVTKSCARGDRLILTATGKQLAIKFPVGGQIIEHRCDTLPIEEFPSIESINGEPATLDDNGRLALHQALECASTDQTRLILNGAFLDTSKDGAHYVIGTDGRHLFSANSFKLPLKDSLIIPSHRFLGWKDFNEDGDWKLRVAPPKKDEATQFEIASDHWRFIARSFEGKFPNWRQVVPQRDSAQTTIEIEPAAVDDLIQTIARLPNHDTVNFSIGLEIVGRRLHLRARSANVETWSRVDVPEAKISGQDVTIHLNRHLLTKALRFGLTSVEIIDALSPLRFSEGGRQMIVMPTRPDSAPTPPRTSPPAASTPAAGAEPHNSPPSSAEQPENKPMPENTGTNGGAARPASTNPQPPAEKSALDSALAQVEVVRGDFRSAIAGLNKLGDLLKQAQRENKASEKEIQSVRQTLRSLQSVRI